MNYNIKFIKRDKLYEICEKIIKRLKKSAKSEEKDLHKNIIDPFSALFDASFNNLSISQWLNSEKIRQVQKSLQNEIGTFHQEVLGSIKDWKNLGTGEVIDIVNDEKKIIAEIKNKFNTTKGNHKIAIYDDLDSLLKEKYVGYTAYYVAILAKKKLIRSFTPSDNKTKKQRPENKRIIEIDGKSFYKIVTGDDDAIYKIYKAIPDILSEILKNDKTKIISDPLFEII
ncbi:MAG: Eco47II family restriction endonuclease, partial [Alphaproteobacteria bacterium]